MLVWRRYLWAFLVLGCVLGHPQIVLESPAIVNQPWDAPPSPNATGNLVFQSVNSLLQLWHNTRYTNGHTIAAASIDPGTLLYHGRKDDGPALRLDKPEWLAVDPEHSYIFCRASCRLLSFVTTRKLRLAYFDGSSASKLGPMSVGNFDSQDIFLWGEVRPDKTRAEFERITKGCEWGKQHGLDGFVRMEMDFEVMMCNFLDGVQLVSNSTIMPSALTTRRRPSHDTPSLTPILPEGWRGAIRSTRSTEYELMLAGSWHYRFPGVNRIRINYSRIVSFFDPALTSLVAARMNQTRIKYRIAGISSDDVQDIRDQLVDVFTRDGDGSGIDWGSITQVVVERYAERLELVRHILEHPETRNVTERASQVRAQVLTMLTPYMLTAAIPPNATTVLERSWISPIVDHCASTFTSWASFNVLTRQEKVIKRAIEEVLHEICRVLGDIWLDAFDVEKAAVEDVRSFVDKWTNDIKGLMEWLDWSVWNNCKPGCGPEKMCYIPTWPWWGDSRDKPNHIDLTPRCISRLEPYDLPFLVT